MSSDGPAYVVTTDVTEFRATYSWRSLECRLVPVYVPTDDGADVYLMYKFEWIEE